MKYLLDTSAVSELVKKKPSRKVVRWIDDRDEDSLFLSVLTFGEIHKGISFLADGARKDLLQTWVDEDLARRFKGRILDVDLEVATEWGRLQARAAARGKPLPVMDSMIAATAIVHHLTVVTRNVRDMERCTAAVHDPWK